MRFSYYIRVALIVTLQHTRGGAAPHALKSEVTKSSKPFSGFTILHLSQ